MTTRGTYHSPGLHGVDCPQRDDTTERQRAYTPEQQADIDKQGTTMPTIDFRTPYAQQHGPQPEVDAVAFTPADPVTVARIAAALDARRAEACRQRYEREQAQRDTPPPPAPKASR